MDWRRGGQKVFNTDDVSNVTKKLGTLTIQETELKTTHSSEKFLILNILHNLLDLSIISQEMMNQCREKVLESELFDSCSITKFGPPNWALTTEMCIHKVNLKNCSDFIQSIASSANLPWRTVLTANVLLQRHCYVLSDSDIIPNEKPQSYFEKLDNSSRILLPTACLLLASKAEESLCRLSSILYSIRSILGDSTYVGIIPTERSPRRGSMSRDPDEAMSRVIKLTECHLLSTLGFDIEVEHPHYYIRLLHHIALPSIELLSDESKAIIKKAYSLLDKSQMDMSYPTSLFFLPATMALAALYLSWFVVCNTKDENNFLWSSFNISPSFKRDMKDFIELLLSDMELIVGWESLFIDGEITEREERKYHQGMCREVDCYQKIEAICEGTYGTVWVAKNKQTRERVALKQLKNTTGSNGFPYYMLREILFLRRLKHPNVVSGQEVLVYQYPLGDYEFYIVMEYISYDLRDIWIAQKDKTAFPLWDEGNVKDLAIQLLQAISYMHNRGLMHRDIKLENILFDEGILKVADLGSIRDAGRTELKLTTAVVTLWYRPPELLLGNTKYTNSIDMWSIGCVLVELLAISALFPGKDVDDMMSRIIGCLGAPSQDEMDKFFLPLPQGPRYVGIIPKIPKTRSIEDILRKNSPNCWDLIHRMLKYDPDARISADEALAHPYFTEEPLPRKYIPE